MQRYLTTPSVDEARESLLMSAYWKIPLQALVLLVGVLMFLFYLFTPSPMLFNRVHDREMRDGPQATEYRALESTFRGRHRIERPRRRACMTRAEAAGDDTQRRGGDGGIPGVRMLRREPFATRRSRSCASRPAMRRTAT